MAFPSRTPRVVATNDILGNVLAAGRFQTFLEVIEAATLTGAFKGAGPFTVFAPTEEAFAALGDGVLDALLADKARLIGVVKSHVLMTRLSSGDVEACRARTMQGGELVLAVDDGRVTVGGAGIALADIECRNGVLHGIDAVLMPA